MLRSGIVTFFLFFSLGPKSTNASGICEKGLSSFELEVAIVLFKSGIIVFNDLGSLMSLGRKMSEGDEGKDLEGNSSEEDLEGNSFEEDLESVSLEEDLEDGFSKAFFELLLELDLVFILFSFFLYFGSTNFVGIIVAASFFKWS